LRYTRVTLLWYNLLLPEVARIEESEPAGTIPR